MKYIFSFALGVTFTIGILFTSSHLRVEGFDRAHAQETEKYGELQSFSKVLNLVQEYYVESIPVKTLILGAIRGLLRELDPHTNFLTPDVLKDFENETSGEFGGLGIEISIQNGILTIISPIEDTPAWQAGVQAGDKVVAVDGKSTKGLSLVDASKFLKGKTGTETILSVIREGKDEPIDIKIKRGKVKIKSVKHTPLENGFHYVRITSFIENTSRDFEKVLEVAEKEKMGIQGLIIDLRKNPGGLLDQATKVSDLFLKPNLTIVSTIGRDPKSKEVQTSSIRKKYENFPILVLVNEHSASASEIVAGALQDHKRALIIGERSFGKGSVQSVIKLGDGSGLKLTIARYYTPSGRSIQAEGIQPDLNIVELDAQLLKQAQSSSQEKKPKGSREKDMDGHLLSEKEKEALAISAEQKAKKWWSKEANKEAVSPREKLLNDDYLVNQAFGYLKAWNLIKTM